MKISEEKYITKYFIQVLNLFVESCLLLHTVKTLYIYILSLLVFFSACNEKNATNPISSNPFEVMPATFKQNVLLESFVAEWANESIESAALIEELKNAYPNRVYPCNLHVGDWLETPYSDVLSNQLGGLIELPKASINRIPLALTSSIENGFTLLSRQHWGFQIGKALSSQAKVAIALESKITSSNQVDLSVYLAHKEALLGDVRLQVYLLQDNIKTSTQSGGSDNYLHQYVLQGIASEFPGELVILTEESEEGEIVKSQFSLINIAGLDKTNLRLMAVLYEYNTDFRKMKVLNVQDVRIGGNKYWD